MSFFDPLTPLSYNAIIIDPPWSYRMYTAKGYAKSPEAQYETMPDEEVLKLPVGELAAGDCVLILWAVWPKLPLAQRCIDRWGFKHITGGSWIKTTKSGAIRIGTGYTLRSACEPFLVARMGPSQARLTDVPNVIVAPAREHSRKPDEMRAIVERMTPGGKRCDLFAREPWPGNVVFGCEKEKFAPANGEHNAA